MTLQWQTVRVFISSTFEDMHAERDYLVKQAFPELREWCEQRKLHLVDIDLRWGVREEDTRNRNVVEVCLNRIDEARPFFLCFLGQRRGWVPRLDDISADTLSDSAFPDLRNYLGSNSVTELEILHALVNPFHRSRRQKSSEPEKYDPVKYAFFYLRDPSYLNQLPPDFPDLQKIYTNNGLSDPSERELADGELNQWTSSTIPDLCKNQNRPLHRYTALWNPSASSPELLLPLECPASSSASNLQWQEKWKGAQIPDIGSGINSPEKIKLAEQYNQRRTSGRLTDFQSQGILLNQIIIDDLKAAIMDRYPDHKVAEEMNDLQTEVDQQQQFLFTNCEGFISRSDDFKNLDEYIQNNQKQLFVLTSPAGAGKSTLLANWINRIQLQSGKSSLETTHFRFIGQSDKSTSVYNLLWYLLREVKETTKKLNREIPKDPQKLRQDFPALLETIGKNGKTIIVLDALNQLDTRLSDLTWLPSQLPENIKLIVSLKSGETDFGEWIRQKQDEIIIEEVKPFSNADDRRKLVRTYLAQYLKELDPQHLETLIESPGAYNPLFLKIALSELRVFGAFANLGEKIRSDFGETPISAFTGVLNRLGKDPAYSPVEPKLAVPLIFGLLAHTRQGLSVDEIANILINVFLEKNIVVEQQAARDTVQLYLRQVHTFLAYRDGSYTFFYESFKLAALEYCTGLEKPLRTNNDWFRFLAEYFISIPLAFDNQEISLTNKHKLLEQPLLCVRAGKWMDCFNTLTDFDFLEAKCHFISVIELETDYQITLENWHGELNQKDILSAFNERLHAERHNLHKFPELLFPHFYNHLTWVDAPNGPLHDLCERYRTSKHNWLRSLQDPRLPTEPLTNSSLMHTKPIKSILFSFDGKIIISVSADKSIKTWDFESGNLLHTLEGFTFDIDKIILAPDGKTLFCSSKNAIQQWEISSGKLVKVFSLGKSINDFQISKDGRSVTCKDSSSNVVWDIETGSVTQSIDVNFYPMISRILPDCKSILCINKENAFQDKCRVELWNLQTGKLIKYFGEHDSWVTALIFSPTGNLAASCDAFNVKCWELVNGDLIRLINFQSETGIEQRISCIAFTPQGKLIISYIGGIFEIWDARTGQFERKFSNEKAMLTSMTVSPDSRWIVGGTNYGAIALYDLSDCKLIRTVSRGKNILGAVAISPQSNFALCSREFDFKINLWDINSNHLIQTLDGHKDIIKIIAFSQDKKKAVSVSTDNEIVLWELINKKMTLTFHAHDDPIRCVAVSHNGEMLLTGSDDKTLRLWDWQSGMLLHQFVGHKGGILAGEISPDGKYITSGSTDKEMILWEVSSGNIIRKFEGHGAPVRKVIFTRNNQLILSCSDDKTIKLWDLNSGELIKSFEGHENAVSSIILALNERSFISISNIGGVVKTWELESGQCIRTLCLNNISGPVSLSSDESMLIGCSYYGHYIKKWDIKDGQLLDDIDLDVLISERKERAFDGKKEILALSISPDNKCLYSGCLDDKISIWDLQTGLWKNSIKMHSGPINSIVLSPDGNLISSNAGDNTTSVYDLKAEKMLISIKGIIKVHSPLALHPKDDTFFFASLGNILNRQSIKSNRLLSETFEHHEKSINDIAITSDGKKAFCCSDDHTITIWDIENHSLLQILEGHKGPVNSIALSPKEDIIASASDDNSIIIWNLETGKMLDRLSVHTGSVRSVAFSHDGKYLVSGSVDHRIILWKKVLWQWRENCHIESHTGSVNSVVFTRDGRFIISGSDDNTVRVWSSDLAKEIHCLNGHSSPVNSIDLSHDNRLICSGSDDKTIKLWQLDTGEPVNTISTSTIVEKVLFTRDPVTILCRAEDYTVSQYDIKTGKKISLWGDPNIRGIPVFTTDNNTLINRSNDNSIMLWDLESGSLKNSLTGHTDWISEWGLSAGGKTIFSRSKKGIVCLWDSETGRQTFTFEGVPYQNSDFYLDLSGEKFICGTKKVKTEVWNLRNGQIIKSFNGYPKAITPSGNLALISFLTLRLLDLGSEKEIQIQSDFSNPSFKNKIRFSRNEDYALLFTGGGNIVEIVNLRDGTVSGAFVNDAEITSSILSKDDQWLVLGDQAGRVWIFEWVK